LGEKIFDAGNVVFLAIVALVTLYPFWHVLIQSVMPYEEAIKSTVQIIPKRITLEAYRYVLSNAKLLTGMRISVLVTIIGTFYQLLITSMAAYGLTKKDLPGRSAILFLIIATMFFSGGLIPYYMLIKQLKLIDNLLVLILPMGISTYNMIVMKTFFSSLPAEVEESAKIDGAGYFLILFRIILPLSGPVLATMSLFIAVVFWNDWYSPMLYLNDKKLWPMSLELRSILIDNNTELTRRVGYQENEFLLANSIKMAVAAISIIPIVIVYPFIQKYFVKGVMIGAVKS
jgi:putative aldouronate transport system permease protein